MRIAAFHLSSHVGGPHVCSKAIYGELKKSGYETKILVPDGSGKCEEFFGDILEVERLPISQIPNPKKMLTFLIYLLKIPYSILIVMRFIRKFKPDIVRTNGALDLVPVIAARIISVPCVVYLNDTILPRVIAHTLVRFYKFIGVRVVAATKNVAIFHGKDDGEDVIYEPVDPERVNSRARAEPVPGTRVRLGLIANWNPVKGHDRFIDIVELLLTKGVDAEATIVGGLVEGQEDFWEPLVKRIQTYGDQDRWRILGYVQDVYPELTRFSILLLTSHSEACPVCVLEAMAAGVPVVAFDVGGVSELLGDNELEVAAGFLVKEGDVEAMVQAIVTLLQSSEIYDRMSKTGPIRVAKSFSLQESAQRHRSLYASMINRS